MNEEVRNEINELIDKLELDCSINEFQDKVDWGYISAYQTLSESFIREFQDRVVWDLISYYQTLSESFIKEFQDKIKWDNLPENQWYIKELILKENIEREKRLKNIKYEQEQAELAPYKNRFDIYLEGMEI